MDRGGRCRSDGVVRISAVPFATLPGAGSWCRRSGKLFGGVSSWSCVRNSLLRRSRLIGQVGDFWRNTRSARKPDVASDLAWCSGSGVAPIGPCAVATRACAWGPRFRNGGRPGLAEIRIGRIADRTTCGSIVTDLEESIVAIEAPRAVVLPHLGVAAVGLCNRWPRWSRLAQACEVQGGVSNETPGSQWSRLAQACEVQADPGD